MNALVCIAHIREHLIVGELLLFARLIYCVLSTSNLALVSIEDGKLDLPEERGRADLRNVRVIDLRRDVALTHGLLQRELAFGRSHTLLRGAKIGTISQRCRLEILKIARHLLIFELPGYVVIGRHGLIPEQLPQIREALNGGEPRLRYVRLKLQLLQFDLQQLVLADVTRIELRLANR